MTRFSKISRLAATAICLIAAGALVACASPGQLEVKRFPDGSVDTVMMDLSVVASGSTSDGWFEIVTAGDVEGIQVEVIVAMKLSSQRVESLTGEDTQHKCPVFLREREDGPKTLEKLLGQYFSFMNEDTPLKEYVARTTMPAQDWCKNGGLLIGVDPRTQGKVPWVIRVKYRAEEKRVELQFASR